MHGCQRRCLGPGGIKRCRFGVWERLDWRCWRQLKYGHCCSTVPVMAYVAAKNANPKRLEVFKQGLAEFGYVEGNNLRIEYREAVLDAEYNGIMADMVDRKVDIIIAANVAATRAAAKATKNISDCNVGRLRSGRNRGSEKFRAAGHERHGHDDVRSPTGWGAPPDAQRHSPRPRQSGDGSQWQ